MVISNAERQARYRENKRLGSTEQELGGKRLSTEAFLALGRLFRQLGGLVSLHSQDASLQHRP